MSKKYQKDIKVVLPKSNPFRDIAVYGAGEEMIKALGGELPDKGKQPDIIPTSNNPYFKQKDKEFNNMKKSNKKGQSPRSILSPEQKMAMQFGWGGAIGSVLGAAAGTFLMPGVGTGLGASIGSGIGNAIDGSIEQNKQEKLLKQYQQPQYQTPVSQMQFAKGGMLNKKGVPHRGTSEQMPYQHQMQSYPNLEFGNGEQMLAYGGDLEDIEMYKDGGIYIKPSKRGTFTAAAKKHGKSVQAFASQVLANKENYSTAMVKKANFARNAAKWKHADGGFLQEPEEGVIERRNKNRSREPQEYATFEENFKHMYADGGLIKRADGSYSKRGLWDNIRANAGSGKKPTKQMLEQERKIKAEEKAMGGYIYAEGGKLPKEILKARLDAHMSPEEANDYIKQYGNGGYKVQKSNDRKGKTHKVTGPDGTVKYFGDPNMGERDKSKHGKEAFYARHAKNLKNNPYFRAYARATWADGGYMNPMGPMNVGNIYYADGGMLNEYNGNTHENGGIPIGPNAEVEGGETSMKMANGGEQDATYIFSDRLVVPGKKYTFAEASKKINNKYNKRTNDAMSNNSKARELNKLMQSQEEERAGLVNNAYQTIAAYGGPIHKYALGGPEEEGRLAEEMYAIGRNPKRMSSLQLNDRYTTPDKLEAMPSNDFNQKPDFNFGTGEQWATGLGYGLQGASLLARQLQLSKAKLPAITPYTMQRQVLNAEPQLREADIQAGITRRNIRDLGASTSSGSAMQGYLASQAAATRNKADILADLQNRQAALDMNVDQFNAGARERAAGYEAQRRAGQQAEQAQLFADYGNLGAGITQDYLLGQTQEGLMESMQNPYFRYKKQRGRNRYNTEFKG